MGSGGDGAVGVVAQVRCHVVDQRWGDQRFVALHVDDDGVIGQPQHGGHFGQTVGAGCVVGTREHGFHVMLHAGVGDRRCIGGNHHARGG